MGAGCCKSDVSKVGTTIMVKPYNKTPLDNNHASAVDSEYVEATVCHENDIGDNEMKNFEFESSQMCSKVLLIKQNGKISAIGSKCSHYGALLSMGVLGNGRVRCPWHGACFNIETGDIEDYPGQDSIPCYQVKIEKGLVKVRAKKSDLDSYKRQPIRIGRDLTDLKTFIIIGGGPSGAICTENLRPNGFGGRIVMVCKEDYLPYDRVKVSKAMDSGIDSILLRNQAFYDENDIEVLLGAAAESLNVKNKEILLSNGEKLNYDKVYIATGSTPLPLIVPGHHLKNIITLRNITDSQQVIKNITEFSHAIVMGTSFTGMEAAAFLMKKVAKVTVIGRSVPFKNSFGEEIGEAVKKFFVNEGVEFEINKAIKQCIGNAHGEIEKIELTDGKILRADILIVAIGSSLNTEFLKGSGIQINENGSIDTNEFLETSTCSDIFVGGDIANSPIFMTGKRETIGHYPLAQYHGKIAALNMCGKSEQLTAVPFFWTMLFGRSFRYAGHGKPTETKIVGSLENLKFVAYYIDSSSKVIAVSSCGYDPVVAQYAELLSQGKILMKSDIENDSFKWTKRINDERQI